MTSERGTSASIGRQSGDERRIGVGIVGYGLAGRVFHAPLIASEPRLQLRAIATSRRDEVLAAHPGAAVVASLDHLLADPAIELIVIATPNATHVPLATQALRGGRHVVMDKPLTTRSGDAEMLASLAAERDVILVPYQNRRWDSGFLTLRRVVEAGSLGRIRTVYLRFERWHSHDPGGWREQPGEGSGLLYDFGPHLIDQALVLFGRPNTVQAILRAQLPGAKTDDFFHAVLGYDGLDVILETSSFMRPSRPVIEVYGERGSFRKSGMDPQDGQIGRGLRPGDPEWGVDATPAELTIGDGSGVTTAVTPERGSYEVFYRGVAEAIRDGLQPPVTAAEARDTIRVIEYAMESDRTDRTVTTEWAGG